MNRVLAIASTVLVAVTGGLVPESAEATGSDSLSSGSSSIVLSQSDEREMRSTFTEYGVEASIQDKLISDFVSGRSWDSLSDGSEPVSVEVNEANGNRTTVSRFDDGSFIVETVPILLQEKSGEVSTNAVKDCAFSSGGTYGGYWNNCRADVNAVAARMYFYFDYQNVQGSGASITDYRHGGGHLVGASLSGYRFQRFSSTRVRYMADAYLSNIFSKTLWIDAIVSGNNASTDYSF